MPYPFPQRLVPPSDRYSRALARLVNLLLLDHVAVEVESPCAKLSFAKVLTIRMSMISHLRVLISSFFKGKFQSLRFVDTCQREIATDPHVQSA
jgi:hypothetical protein